MVKEFRSLSLLDILPESIRGDTKLQAAAQAFDRELQAVTYDIKENMLISRINELPESVLDLLAWQWHVDYYQTLGLDIETKRRLIRESIAWHRIKDTPAAVEQLVSAVFSDARVQEWYEYGGESFIFRLFIDGHGAFDDERSIDRLMLAVNASKNKRSHLGGITIERTDNLLVPYGMALTVSQTERVDLAPRPNSIRAPTSVGFASVEDGAAFIDPSRLSSADVGISAVILVQGAFPKEVRSALQPEFVVPEDEIISSLLAGIGQSLGGLAEIRPCEPKKGALEQSCFGMAIETRIEAVEPSRVGAGANSLWVGMVCFGTAIASIGCDPSGLDDMDQDIYPTSMLPFGPPFMLG